MEATRLSHKVFYIFIQNYSNKTFEYSEEAFINTITVKFEIENMTDKKCNDKKVFRGFYDKCNKKA